MQSKWPLTKTQEQHQSLDQASPASFDALDRLLLTGYKEGQKSRAGVGVSWQDGEDAPSTAPDLV